MDVNPNQYGIADESEIESFEKSIQAKLPSDYREHLLNINGGSFGRDVLRISDHEGETTVHHVYGLNDGPDYQQLSSERLSFVSKHYLLEIADDAGGNPIALILSPKRHYGKVCIHLKDSYPSDQIVIVARSFKEFVNSLMTHETMMEELKEADPEFYEEFMARLNAAKAEHEQAD